MRSDIKHLILQYLQRYTIGNALKGFAPNHRPKSDCKKLLADDIQENVFDLS